MLRIIEIRESEIIVSERYAITFTETERGVRAEIEEGGVFTGLRASGLDEAEAMAALVMKVQEAASGESLITDNANHERVFQLFKERK
jgi:hypothetical protein